MQLTGKQIIERGIIKGYCEEAVQQQGIDVRIKSLKYVKNYFKEAFDITEDEPSVGIIPVKGKTILPPYDEVSNDGDKWNLTPGYYEVELEESCDIPSNATLHYKTRSSLVRCGAVIHSGQFDAGFKTDNMGCFLHVICPIIIYKGARIAQAIVFESDDVQKDSLYDGQWQNDKQRI